MALQLIAINYSHTRSLTPQKAPKVLLLVHVDFSYIFTTVQLLQRVISKRNSIERERRKPRINLKRKRMKKKLQKAENNQERFAAIQAVGCRFASA